MYKAWSPIVVAFLLPGAATAATALTAAQWRDDLRVLAEELPKTHRDAFHKVPRAEFEQAIADLEARIPGLADHEVIVGLAGIVARIGDGHTRLTLPEDPAVASDLAHTSTPPPADPRLVLRHLPLEFELYPDGLFVRAATADYRDLVGARVLRVGRLGAEAALAAVRPIVSADNEMGFRLLAPKRLAVPEVLHALGVTESPERTELEVVDRAGHEREVVVEPLPRSAPPEPFEAGDAAGAPLPLWRRQADRPYWFEHLASSRTLYAQVNRLADAPEDSVARFAGRLAQALAEQPVERLVIDLRHNSGGDNSLTRPIVLCLLRHDQVNRHGRLFVLIGRRTFSAGQNLVNDLEHWTEALFVGEPTGASPSGYGDARKIRLPHSGLTVRVSTVYWRDWTPDERRPWTAPDLPAPMTAADDFAGRDPALAAAIAFAPLAAPAAQLEQLFAAGGLPAALRRYYRLATDPRAVDGDLAPARAVLERLSRPQP